MLKSRGHFGHFTVNTIHFDRDDEVIETHAHEEPHMMAPRKGAVRVRLFDPSDWEKLLVDAELYAEDASKLEIRPGVPHSVEPIIVPAIVDCTFAALDGNRRPTNNVEDVRFAGDE